MQLSVEKALFNMSERSLFCMYDAQVNRIHNKIGLLNLFRTFYQCLRHKQCDVVDLTAWGWEIKKKKEDFNSDLDSGIKFYNRRVTTRV